MYTKLKVKHKSHASEVSIKLICKETVSESETNTTFDLSHQLNDVNLYDKLRRYFEELKEAKEIRPGHVSERLREALGLDPDKLPIWIYRMRIIGYPPGWLDYADMSKTVVPIIEDGSHARSSQDTDPSATYNPEQLVVYPGFNAPLPEGVNDDWQFLRMPPMMLHQQLDFATSTMKRPKPVPYRKFKLNTDASQDSSVIEANLEGKESPKEIATDSEPEVIKTRKVVSVGAHVPESYIQARKPPLEKWSENNTLSELIYFENLPNYTGVFDRMRGVLGGIRNRLFSTPGKESASTTETLDLPHDVSSDEILASSSQTEKATTVSTQSEEAPSSQETAKTNDTIDLADSEGEEVIGASKDDEDSPEEGEEVEQITKESDEEEAQDGVLIDSSVKDSNINEVEEDSDIVILSSSSPDPQPLDPNDSYETID